MSSNARGSTSAMLSSALFGLLLCLGVPSQLGGGQTRLGSRIAFGWERQSLQFLLNKLQLCRILDDGFLETNGFSGRHALAFLQRVVGVADVSAQLDGIGGIGRVRCCLWKLAIDG